MNNLEIDFFLIDYTSNGGVERVTKTLVSLFAANGIKVNNLISLQANNSNSHFDFPNDINCVVLNSSRKDLESRIYEQFVALKIKKIIFQGDNMTISLAILKAAKKAGIIAIPQYHGSPHAYLDKYIYLSDILCNPVNVFKLSLSLIQKPFKKLKLKKFLLMAENGVVCVSKGVRDELLEIFKGNKFIEDNVFTIYNPLTFSLCDISLDSDIKKNHIVYISRLEKKHKNSFLVIKAWGVIAKKYPSWELHILGDGSLKPKMEKFSIENTINNVFFHGFVNNVSEYLKEGKISVLSSNCEGLGMGILESISYKNAIVSTKSDGGITDLVSHEFNGLLVPKDDYESFSRAVEKLINNDNLIKEYAENGFSLLDDFSESKIIEKWVKILN